MSDYNPKEKEPEPQKTRAEHLSCQAQGCPLPGSVSVLGGSWCCVYHSAAARENWPKVTDLLNSNKRVFHITELARKLTSAEFDSLNQSGAWKINERIKPLPKENHAQWVWRVISLAHKSIKDKTIDIMQDKQQSFDGIEPGKVNVSQAVAELTSGVLLK